MVQPSQSGRSETVAGHVSLHDRGRVITLNSGHGVTGISSVPIWKATV